MENKILGILKQPKQIKKYSLGLTEEYCAMSHNTLNKLVLSNKQTNKQNKSLDE